VEIKRMTESNPMPVVRLLATCFVKKAFGWYVLITSSFVYFEIRYMQKV
jgi:hypothetical protein